MSSFSFIFLIYQNKILSYSEFLCDLLASKRGTGFASKPPRIIVKSSSIIKWLFAYICSNILMSIVCGSLTEKDNPLSLCTYLIPNLNFFSILKLRFFWNEFKMFLFIPVFLIWAINTVSSNLLDCPSRHLIALNKRTVCLLCKSLSSDSYFVSYFEFHSTTMLSSKNFPSSSSGISADSKSRYSGSKLRARTSDLNPRADIDGSLARAFHILFSKLLSQTNCHNPLSKLTRERRVYIPTISPDSFMNLIFQNLYSQKSAFLFQGSHPLSIREVRRFSSSFILWSKKK